MQNPVQSTKADQGSLSRLDDFRRPPGLENWQYLLGKELQPPLRDFVGGTTEAESDVELEVADELAALLEPTQDFVGLCLRSPTTLAAENLFLPK